MNIDRSMLLVYGVDKAVLVGKPEREERGEIADEFLAAEGNGGHLLLQDDLELVL
jgi:hypothetical protein